MKSEQKMFSTLKHYVPITNSCTASPVRSSAIYQGRKDILSRPWLR